MKLKIERIHPTFGAELTNINSKDINSDQVFSEIRRAFTDFGMIFVRSLYLSLSEQVELGRRFGEVQVHGRELCEPCRTLQQHFKVDDLVRRLTHKGGLCCEILTTGIVGVGDEVKI